MLIQPLWIWSRERRPSLSITIMPNGKRLSDFLGVRRSVSFSIKRSRSPASQITTGNTSALNPLTQPAPVNTSQPAPNCHHEKKSTGKAVLTNLAESLGILQQGCGIFAPLVTAAETLQEVLKVIEAKSPDPDGLQDMASDLAQWAALLSAFVEENQPIRMSKQMENLIHVLRREADYLKEPTEGGSTRLDGCEQNTHQLESCHRQVEEALRQLLESLLNGMLLARDALYDSSYADKIERGPCLENTRVMVLDGVRQWIYNLGETKVYWINGMAGTGKTTIAYSVCEELAKNKRLGASFFVSRASSQCQDVSRILPTIAYQLARVSYPYRSTLCRILHEELNVGKRKLSVQFEHLIKSPLRIAADKMPQGLVVVIDALDECADPRTTEMIVDMLCRHASTLPVRFIITSRPHYLITNAIFSKDGGSRSILHLHNVEEQMVRTDIKKYLAISLAQLKPTDGQIEWLTEQAGVLFIYAATLVRYVLATGFGTGSRARLEAVLAPSTMRAIKKDRAIDRLYKAILEGVLQDDEREQHEVDVIERVLWTVVCVKEPVTKQTLAILVQVEYNQVTEALRPLQSVIHVSESTGIVSTLHASFPEFVLDPSRSSFLGWSQETSDQRLAIRCFSIMEQQLRFNICGLKSSYDFDQDIPDIDARVEASISPELFYARRFWAEHLAQTTNCDTLNQYLDLFLEVRLLLWMEVLNLKGWMKHGQVVLMEAKRWLTRNDPFLDDVLEFVVTFTKSQASLSTPHLYISHLPLGPKRSKVRQIYLKRTQGLVRVEGTAAETQQTWPLPPGAVGSSSMGACSQHITLIKVSPDGTKIATASRDGTIFIWDSYTGSVISKLLRRQAGPVTAQVLAFSPDGSLIAAAFRLYSRQIIKIWNVQNGALIVDPITVHRHLSISSICFSPDGARIALTETYDRNRMARHLSTIVVLDLCSGNVLLSLDLPDGTVSVVFSSDNAFVLSLLFDGKIQAWDSYTGTPHTVDSSGCWNPDIKHPWLGPQKGNSENCLGLPRSWLIPRDKYANALLTRYKHENFTAFAQSLAVDGPRVFSGSSCHLLNKTNHTHDEYVVVRAWDIYRNPSDDDYVGLSWDIRSGWVRDRDSRPIIYIPEEWRRIFPLPPNSLAMGPEGNMRVYMAHLLLGNSWAGCYHLEPPNASP
ncbi:unnamed protein product [Rhizoctonia solani]|uniref:NACHT domain-containing protein n=1 Tax=Rhizoctonia solani TaxID=456999 RepID=A0A8H3D8C8_9AGAM|nr:unnamed protein product [Rhizoctonia solani]